jgi:hypothetical protein
MNVEDRHNILSDHDMHVINTVSYRTMLATAYNDHAEALEKEARRIYGRVGLVVTHDAAFHDRQHANQLLQDAKALRKKALDISPSCF